MQKDIRPRTWSSVKAAIIQYGNVLKQDECATKPKQLRQGTMTLFTEVEDLNLYAQLDPDSLPILLKPGLNVDLRRALSISNSIYPVTS